MFYMLTWNPQDRNESYFEFLQLPGYSCCESLWFTSLRVPTLFVCVTIGFKVSLEYGYSLQIVICYMCIFQLVGSRYICGINNCLSGFIDNNSLKKLWSIRHLRAMQIDALNVLSSLCIHTTDFFKSMTFKWINLLVRRLPCWALLPLIKPLKAMLKARKAKINAELCLLQQWPYLSTSCNRVFCTASVGKHTRPLDITSYNWLGCEWPDLNEDSEVRPHLLLLINILQLIVGNSFISHWKAM